MHLNPFLFLLVPGYVIFPSPYYLLIIQTLALALGAWPLYLLANHVLQNKKPALAVSIAYLLYPALHWVNWYDFHPIAFLTPLFLAAFYFAEIKNWKWFAVFALLAASVQEDAVLAVAFLGIYLILRKEYKMGIATFLLSILYFLISVKFIMPYFGGGLLRLDRYDPAVFYSPALLLKTAFSYPKLIYMLNLLWPVAFLPLLAPAAWLLLAPGLAQNLLTRYSPQFSGNYQYDSVLIGAIFIATVFGLRKANKNKKVIGLLVVASALAFLVRSPVGFLNFPTEFFKENPHRDAMRNMLSHVPAGASVAANTNLVPHLADRERVYMLGAERAEPDVVLIDGADYFGFKTPEDFQKYAASYAASGLYEARILDDRYYILILIKTK